ncbi:hypothetical protein jhhlp_005812 [Lomentospora prolificans]|uniref:Uncharacterized protein n=1 Tax=Lomentospora prolificans TaxID=41688 RepID=A0A2N3N450_9PEZI|nr:hypothetical protein jhhlp_005812 [Lomentospora prolificans]
MGLIAIDPLITTFQAIVENWAIVGGAVSFGFVAVHAVLTLRTWSRLRHIKGPRIAGFTNLWMVKTIMGGNAHLDFQKLADEFGPLVRIGPNELLTGDPELLRRINGARSKYVRSTWYMSMKFDPDQDNVLSQLDDDLHNVLRTKMNPGYSGKEVDALEHKVDRNVKAFISLINDRYLSTPGDIRPFDFGSKAQFFTLDVISDISYSEAFGCLSSDSDTYGYVAAIEENLPAVMLISTIPSLSWIMESRLVKKLLPSDKDQLGFGRVTGICKRKAAERFGPDRIEQRDMLGSFVRHGLTQREAQSETLLQILAGSETSATAIRSTLLYIITCPAVYTKLVTEILEASKTLPSPIPNAASKDLPYLQAVIKEGLRIFPPVASVFTKTTPPEGDTWNGVHIPGGTGISYNAFGLARNKKVWGEDAALFRPERWLEGTAEEIRARESVLDMVFGYGKYKCLGQSIAYMELNKIFFELLRNFDIHVVNPTDVWKVVYRGVFMQHNFWVVATKRE